MADFCRMLKWENVQGRMKLKRKQLQKSFLDKRVRYDKNI